MDINGIEFRGISRRRLLCVGCGAHATILAALKDSEAAYCGNTVCLTVAVQKVRGEDKNITSAPTKCLLIFMPKNGTRYDALTTARVRTPQTFICPVCGTKTQAFFLETPKQFNCPNGKCGVAAKI